MNFKEGDYILLPETQYYNASMREKYSPSKSASFNTTMYDLLDEEIAWRIMYAPILTVGIVQIITKIISFDGIYKIKTDFTYVNGASGKEENFEFITSGIYQGDLKIMSLDEIRDYKLNKLIDNE